MSTSPSASISTATLAERPEAEPLPKKVGEIGYTAPKSPEIRQDSQGDDEPALPARHPADRLDEPAPTAPNTTSPPLPAPPATVTVTTNTSNSASSVKKTWRQRLTVGGVSILSIIRILLLLMFLGGTGAAWGITIRIFGSGNDAPSSNGDNGDPYTNAQVNFGDSSNNDSNDDSGNSPPLPPSFSSLVILHVSFTIVMLVELLFLERAIFHARAERYLYKRGMSRGDASASMGITPWSRPSLPTYAAALAESGVGTGDAEDNLIAIPPPPAYGNTRGSVLLLSGFLRDSLVRNLNRSSQRSSAAHPSRPTSPREMEEGRGSRPISYDASEEVDNAKRAMELEAALSKLENGGHDGSNRQP